MAYRQPRGFLGVGLIGLGAALLTAQLFGPAAGAVFMLALGGAFLFGYLVDAGGWMLIPGALLAGLGVGGIGAAAAHASAFMPIGLGLGFLVIYPVGQIKRGWSHWWPLVPGFVLL